MDKENTFTPEQMMDMLKSITSNAKIGQLIIENHGTVEYNEASESGRKTSVGDSYFDTPAFEESIQKLSQHMEQHKSIHWSYVYYYLNKKMGLGEMSASAFGKFIESHGGPNEQKVRKDGNYQPSSHELLRDKPIIESVSAFFSVD